MKRQREDGCVFAYCKSDGSAYAFPRQQHEALKSAWMAGKAFYEGSGFYGAPLTVKLGDIVAIIDASPETLAAQRADVAADKAEDAING